jgi:membrane protein DedA with SNARE-associated domain
VLLLDGSVTNSLVTLATNLINDAGYAGVAALTAMSGVIGVPGTEVTMLFAGFNVSEHHLTLLGVIFFGVLGDLVGATIAYVIGFYGLHELLERYSGPLHATARGRDLAKAWFERWGPPVIVVSRCIPLVRAAFPYAAGTAKMSYLKFIPMAAIGSVIWIGGLALLGNAVGHDWPTWKKHLEVVDYVVLGLAVCLVVWWIVRRVRRGREGQASAV